MSFRLNSTVFYTLNTSGVAPQTYPDANGPPALPGGGWWQNASLNTPALYPGGGNNDRNKYPEIPPTPARSDTLVIWHHGHSQPCDSRVRAYYFTTFIPVLKQSSQPTTTLRQSVRTDVMVHLLTTPHNRLC